MWPQMGSPLSHFVNLTLSLPLCYSLNIKNYRMRENKFFAYMAAQAYHVNQKGRKPHP